MTVTKEDSVPSGQVMQEQDVDEDTVTNQKINFDQLVGEIILDDPTSDQTTYGRPFPETLAEFDGGQDSLYAFLKQHLRYPDWEIDNAIEGRVFVTFNITEEGKIREPRIRRSVPGSMNFDSEVLRVIGLMPDWKPAMNGNRAVASEMSLPISFKLPKRR